jgi:hypothetical protein
MLGDLGHNIHSLDSRRKGRRGNAEFADEPGRDRRGGRRSKYTGHWVLEERPKEIMDALLKFL